jgi:hypothetical protein
MDNLQRNIAFPSNAQKNDQKKQNSENKQNTNELQYNLAHR